MTPREAKTIGRRKTIKATAVIIAILLIVFMIQETRGDFANGILFYIQDITNIHTIAVLTILFGFTFLFGGMAGKEIILDKKNFIVISIKYLVPITLSSYFYLAIVGLINAPPDFPKNIKFASTYYLIPLAQRFLWLFIPMLAAWLWATYQMRLKMN